MAITTDNNNALLRLLQLSSATLPVGAFAFSQGLEAAVELGWIKDKSDTYEWLAQQLRYALVSVDLPVLRLAMSAAADMNISDWNRANEWLLASRETAELRLTDMATGEALLKLLRQLQLPLPQLHTTATFIAVYGWAAVYWQIDWSAAALGLLWSWLENQVVAATKLVPLGQTQAQQLLGELQPLLVQAMHLSESVAIDDIGSSLPAMAIASARHESQYTRLFRS